MEHNANTVNESQKTIFNRFANNITIANDIVQIANSGVRFIRLIIRLLLWRILDLHQDELSSSPHLRLTFLLSSGASTDSANSPY